MNSNPAIWSLKINQRLHFFSEPLIMGILNLSPDSFYDGQKEKSDESLLNHCERMVLEGAHIIDIGACSSRPRAVMPDIKEELQRLLPVIKSIRKNFSDLIISVDTFRTETAEAAVSEGANIINDIGAGNLDAKMFELIARLKVPYIIMHMKGMPENMQTNPHYDDIITEIYTFFSEKIKSLTEIGVSDILIDPGFGFGKTQEHNYCLLRHLSFFAATGRPIVTGLSRKSMIYKALNSDPGQALNGTTVLNTLALIGGSNILRVHDVKEAAETIKLVNLHRESKLHIVH